MRLSPKTRILLIWWLTSPALELGKSFPPLTWTVLLTDASQLGWEEVLGTEMVQEIGHQGSLISHPHSVTKDYLPVPSAVN